MFEKTTTSFLGYNVFSGDKEFFSNGFAGVVTTICPHSYILARKDPSFRKALMTSDLILPDGIGIVIASRVINGEKLTKIAGSDMHDVILKALNQRKGSCFYLGSTDRTLRMIKERISGEYPSLRVGTFSPPFKPVFSEDDNLSMIKAINEFRPDVLFVGMTAPKQEKWVYENRSYITASVICSVGAVFDFYAGTIRRSGKFWISIGLEWLPRLLREPRRLWRRSLVSAPLFLWLVLREKLLIKCRMICNFSLPGNLHDNSVDSKLIGN